MTGDVVVGKQINLILAFKSECTEDVSRYANVEEKKVAMWHTKSLMQRILNGDMIKYLFVGNLRL